ncbi:hypothetical protein [Coleofasciculus chthonoplastes]
MAKILVIEDELSVRDNILELFPSSSSPLKPAEMTGDKEWNLVPMTI